MKECNRLSFHEELYMKELNSPRHEVLGGVVLLLIVVKNGTTTIRQALLPPSLGIRHFLRVLHPDKAL